MWPQLFATIIDRENRWVIRKMVLITSFPNYPEKYGKWTSKESRENNEHLWAHKLRQQDAEMHICIFNEVQKPTKLWQVETNQKYVREFISGK